MERVCSPLGLNTSTVINGIIHVFVLFSFLTVFFHLFVSKIETKIMNEQLKNIIDTDFKDSLEKADKSGKSKVYAFFLNFSSGDNGRIDCNDYSKKIEKKYGWEDNLRIALVSSEFRKWLNEEAF